MLLMCVSSSPLHEKLLSLQDQKKEVEKKLAIKAVENLCLQPKMWLKVACII